MRNKNLLTEPVYLFPLTAEASLALHILRSNGVTVAGICDNNVTLHGKSYADCPIIPIVNGDSETIVVCGYKHHRLSHLFAKSITLEEIIESSDIDNAIIQLKKKEFEELAPKQINRFRRINQEIRQILLPKDAKNVINALDIVLTERCNLRCKCCEVLIQHFENPRHIPLEQHICEFDEIMSKFDYVRDVHVIGGEPFLYPQLLEYSRYIATHRDKIGSLYYITNGTVVPNKEILKSLKKSNAFIMISDYDDLSRKKDELTFKCKSQNIGVQVTDYPWIYENQLVYDDVNSPQQKFDDCYERKHIYTLRDGKLYYCHFLASGETLRAMPFSENNGIFLTATANEILRYISKEDAPPGCRFCSGHDLNAPRIAKAEQTKKRIPYKWFGRIY